MKLVADRSGEIAGFELERPVPGDSSDVYSLSFEGEVVAQKSRVAYVRVGDPGWVSARTRVDLERPHAAAAHPDLPWAGRSGFKVAITTVRLPTDFEVMLVAGLEDGREVPLAVVKGRRRRFEPPPHSGPVPLCMTSLGRSGSTWLSDLLDHHPQIISMHPYRYEPRMSAYWLEVFSTLAEPCSYGQALATDQLGSNWWTGTTRLQELPLGVDAAAETWLGGTNVEDLALFCKERIDSFYRGAVPDEYGRAEFFAEKLWPGSYLQRLLKELYPGTQEIVLVRDFRDMACSALAYGRRRGAPGFGREAVGSDEEYIRGPLLRQARVMLDHWRRLGGYLLRYEDLVLEPTETLGRMLSHLGLDAGEPTIDAMVSGASRGGDHQTASSTSASMGRWRTELSDSHIELFGEGFDELFEAFGYEPA